MIVVLLVANTVITSHNGRRKIRFLYTVSVHVAGDEYCVRNGLGLPLTCQSSWQGQPKLFRGNPTRARMSATMDNPERHRAKNQQERSMTKSRWIAVDVDGVLADHVNHILPVLKYEYGLDITVSQIRTWDFPLGSTTFGTILRRAQKLPDFVLTTPAVPGASKAMLKLSSDFNLAIVTARPPESTDATQCWLRANGFPFDDFSNLSEGTKHNTAVPCDLLVDDYKVNIVEYLRNTDGSAILFSRPWNADHAELEPYLAANRLKIAADWREVLELVPQLL